MARIKGLEEGEASVWMRPLFIAYKRVAGRLTEPIKVQARIPSIAWFGNLLGEIVDRSGRVETRLHVLVQLRAAQVVECPF